MNLNHSKDQFSNSESIQPTLNNLTSQSNLESEPTSTSSHVTSVIQPRQMFQNNFVHPNTFFYRPYNDLYNYHVNCKEISFSMAIQLLNEFNDNNSVTNFNQNEYNFFYQQSDNRIYQISCEIVTPLTLNKIIYGIEIIEQNFGERLAFTFDQKENLKFYLLQHLSHYLLKLSKLYV